MEYLQNLHTHSTFCDGRDTPEEMIKYAIKKDFNSVGFSGHSTMPFEAGYCMTEEGTLKYKEEINRLKEKYQDKIDIFLGTELDLLSKIDLSGYDYIIGSVHYIKMGKKIVEVDCSRDRLVEIVDEYFDSDPLNLARAYFNEYSELAQIGKVDIIGHFDLIAKFYDYGPIFDRDSKEYQDIGFGAIEAMAGKIPLFEVNTGGMARGYHNIPYPYPAFIKEFKRKGFGAVITADCHNKKYIDYYFSECEDLLKECGFNEVYVLKKDGFVPIKL